MKRTAPIFVALILATASAISAAELTPPVLAEEVSRLEEAVNTESAKPLGSQAAAAYERFSKAIDALRDRIDRALMADTLTYATSGPAHARLTALSIRIDKASTRAARFAAVSARGWPVHIRDAVLREQVLVGMTPSQVIEAWGPPLRMVETVTAAGRSEQWVYGIGTYVHLTNGIVTAIQTTR
jgi:hypothetical protein